MRLPRMVLGVSWLTAACISIPVRVAGLPCPQTCIRLYDPPPTCTWYREGAGHLQSAEGGGSAQRVSYNLLYGSLDGWVESNPGARALGEIVAVDEYRLVGSGVVDSALVMARLTVDAPVQWYYSPTDAGSATITARVFADGRSVEVIRTAASIPFSRLQFHAELPVWMRPEVPVRIGFQLVIEGFDNVQANVTSRLNFFDLPQYHGVLSCQGFNGGNGLVPVRAATWGSLKLRYR